MKTFKDLKFERHPMTEGIERLPLSMRKKWLDAKHASLNFGNGYGVSVVFGDMFYSNGIDTYELAILRDGKLCYDTYITDDVMGYLTEGEITNVMIKRQELKA